MANPPRFNRLVLTRHTTQFETMLAFYRDHIGLNVIESWDEPGNQGAILALPGDVEQAHIEVIHLGHVAKPDTLPANMALNLYVDDATAWRDTLAEAGIPIARDLKDVPWGLRSFGVDDPEGLRIWFQQQLAEAAV